MLSDYELDQLQEEWDEQQIIDAVQSEEFESMDYDERHKRCSTTTQASTSRTWRKPEFLW